MKHVAISRQYSPLTEFLLETLKIANPEVLAASSYKLIGSYARPKA